MSLSKKRKVDTECRVFQEKWTTSYFFTKVTGKPVCLLCSQQVSVLKEYNIRRHYETHHGEKYDRLQGQLRKEKINDMLASLKKQQSVFTRSREISDAAVKASYLIANEIASASKPYCEGEFVKTCMLKAAEIVCPEKRQAFANISLTRNTVTDRIADLSADLDSQKKHKVKSFVAFSVAIDESTDITDVAQLAIFIRGVDETLAVTEEFLELVPMTDTTTANDIFSALVEALDRVGVDWFQVFGELETEFAVFRSPFTVKAADLPVDIQLEIIDLQCDQDLKDKFASLDLDTFYRYLLPGYPKLTALAAKVLSMFGTTYLCEQVFSVMNMTKTKLRSRLTHKHLNDILKLAATQDFKPDIDALVRAKRCQVSGEN